MRISQKVILFSFLALLAIQICAFKVCGQDDSPGSGADKAQAFLIYQKAFKSFQASDFDTCTNLCKQAIALDPRNKDLRHLDALALSEAGDSYNAMLEFRTALNIDYNFIPCRNNFGIFLKKTGKTEEAQMDFQQCIKIKPEFPDAHYHLGQILQEKGDLDHAIEEYETAVRLNPNYFEAQRDLGLAIYERVSSSVADITQSEEKLEIAEKLSPENPMIHYYLGNIYCAAGKLDDAETDYRKALFYDVKLTAAHFELGRLRYYRGDLDRCLFEMKIAAQINPVYSESKKYPKVDLLKIKEMIARCSEDKQCLIEAIEAWKEVGAMQRNNTDTLKHVAELERQQRAKAKKDSKLSYNFDEMQNMILEGIKQADNGDLSGSKATFEKILENDPQCFEAQQNLGALKEAAGDLNGAMADYKQAMALMPKFDGAYYNLAYLLEKFGLPADAGLMYQRFHEIAGKYPYDSKHIVGLQQEDARRRAREEELRKRGY
jgi:tetratricopeptide (TPR) repeat protein